MPVAIELRIRLASDVYKQVDEASKLMGIPVADLLRHSIELYLIASSYKREGAVLMFENRDGDKVKLLIPGLDVI